MKPCSAGVRAGVTGGPCPEAPRQTQQEDRQRQPEGMIQKPRFHDFQDPKTVADSFRKVEWMPGRSPEDSMGVALQLLVEFDKK